MKLLLSLFFVATLALAYWLWANVLAWGMAGFDCSDDYFSCRKHLLAPIAVPVIIWIGCARLLWVKI